MAEHVNIPAKAIAVLDTQQEVDDLEQDLAQVLRADWPDWVFSRAIDTDLRGPQGQHYVRVSSLVATALGFHDDVENDVRRGPPAQARVPQAVRDKVADRLQTLPEDWVDAEL